jgi:hypothetical protein
MKRLAIILISLLVVAVSYGQNTALDAGSLKNSTTTYFDMDRGLSSPINYRYAYGTTADTVGVADSSFSYTFTVVDMSDQLEAECRIKLDSTSGTPTLNVALKGKFSWNDAWTSIANSDWAGTSADTTIILQSTTAVPYRFYQIFVDVTATTAQEVKLNYLELGVFK